MAASALSNAVSGALNVVRNPSAAMIGASKPLMSQTSARVGYDGSQLIKQVQELAAQNTQMSAQQAEELRKWQEQQNDIAMQFSASEAAKNRDWQKMMSDTAHQREVRDLMAAGLNPVLSAMGGNGAAVTSGATASGVTSSGAKGEVDQSASAGLVSLLGSLLSSQTQLANAALSARTNEAISDKTNAMNELIARITGDYSLQRQHIAGDYGLKTAGVSAKAMRDVEAMRESHDRYIHENYPSNLVQAVAALLSGLSGGQTSSFIGNIGEGITEFFDSFDGSQKAKDYWTLPKYEYDQKYGKSSGKKYGSGSR